MLERVPQMVHFSSSFGLDVRQEWRILEICPHGRPIVKRIRLADLLREFERL